MAVAEQDKRAGGRIVALSAELHAAEPKTRAHSEGDQQSSKSVFHGLRTVLATTTFCQGECEADIRAARGCEAG